MPTHTKDTKAAKGTKETPAAMVTVTLRNSVIYRETHYGPGVVEVPAQLAEALGLADERVASAPGLPDAGTHAGPATADDAPGAAGAAGDAGAAGTTATAPHTKTTATAPHPETAPPTTTPTTRATAAETSAETKAAAKALKASRPSHARGRK